MLISPESIIYLKLSLRISATAQMLFYTILLFSLLMVSNSLALSETHVQQSDIFVRREGVNPLNYIDKRKLESEVPSPSLRDNKINMEESRVKGTGEIRTATGGLIYTLMVSLTVVAFLSNGAFLVYVFWLSK